VAKAVAALPQAMRLCGLPIQGTSNNTSATLTATLDGTLCGRGLHTVRAVPSTRLDQRCASGAWSTSRRAKQHGGEPVANAKDFGAKAHST